MNSNARLLLIPAALLMFTTLCGCPDSVAFRDPNTADPNATDNTGGDPNDAAADPNDAGDGAQDPNAADPNGVTDPNAVSDPNSAADPNDADPNAATATARIVAGTISSSASAKMAARSETGEATYSVVVHAVESGASYRGQTDDSGAFEIEIPDGETAATYMVSVLTPDGRPGGPVLFGADPNQAYTGVALDGPADLGTIYFPDDPSLAPIEVGEDAEFGSGAVQDDVIARLDANGVPVGMQSFGRGVDAQGAASDNTKQQADADQDGLVDDFDADDDGDGTIDDFDDDAALNPGSADGLIINFFMNLKLADEQAVVYFSGDTAAIETSLKTDTVITFEVNADAGFTKTITGARVISPPAPAPSYLSAATKATEKTRLWSTDSYALQPDSGANHYQEWVVPNAIMATGDTFTVELTFDDGTTAVYSRMINFVFKSIPKLINQGPPGALTPYTAPSEIVFDGTQDLGLEWAPPVDDFGTLLTGLGYFFEVFYYDADGAQIYDIDVSTWSTAIPGWDAQRTVYEVAGSTLTTLTTLSASNTFTVDLPQAIFVDTLQTTSGPVDVASYKVDIAAQNNGNNAALMIRCRKAP